MVNGLWVILLLSGLRFVVRGYPALGGKNSSSSYQSRSRVWIAFPESAARSYV